jgi:DNA-binding NarL/FixJ family response regulator
VIYVTLLRDLRSGQCFPPRATIPLMKKILLVDDHQLVRTGLRSLLDGKYEICGEAANGHDAVEKAGALRPDLILMDFGMPMLNGLDASHRIRLVDPSVKIVLFTMHDSLEMGAKAAVAGVDAVLSKGSAPRELFALLDRLLDGSAERTPSIY